MELCAATLAITVTRGAARAAVAIAILAERTEGTRIEIESRHRKTPKTRGLGSCKAHDYPRTVARKLPSYITIGISSLG